MKSAVAEIARDVKDNVGEAIEQGVQSVVGPKLSPQQIQQKQLEDQRKLTETRKKIAWYKNIDEEQKRVRQANAQKESQRLQSQQQEKQVKIQQEKAKKVKKTPEEILRTQVEIKVGKGIGG